MKKKVKKINSTGGLKQTADLLKPKSDENEQYEFFQKSAVCLMLELYPDDVNYNYKEVLNHLIKYANDHDCFYAYILHDKDVWEKTSYTNDYKIAGKKGSKKKVHTHFVICSKTDVPFRISDVFLGVKFPVRFIRIVKPKDIQNVVLYLSHIKYSNKYQYKVEDIKTNRPDYVKTLHEEYQPSSAVSFVIDYLSKYKKPVTFAKLWDVALNKNDIPYNEYYKNYNLIKDIVKEHNLECRDDNLKQIAYDKERNAGIIAGEKEKQKIYDLASTFGTVDIDINGRMFKVVSMPEKKKGV